MSNDGGYYAIKGFEFQIDKNILEILDSEDDISINIEQIQDIDSPDFVMQVKYRETANYSDTQIREPVIQLIEEFRIDQSKKYKLYCHFNDKDEFIEKIDINKLNLILVKSTGTSDRAKNINRIIDTFDDDLKIKFIDNFELIFAPEYEIQLNKLLLRISKEFDIDLENAIFHHGNLSYYLRQKVLSDRTCTKKELLKHISIGRNIIFTYDFRKYNNDKAYFNYIKNKYFSKFNIDDYERFFILELKGDESVAEIKNEVLKIKQKFYIKSGVVFKKIIKSGAPYIYFKNIDSEKLKQLKKELQEEKHFFNDGYCFLGSEFCLEAIKESSSLNNGICLKFINNNSDFQALLNEKLNKTKEVYQFYIEDCVDLKQDIKNIKIRIDNLSEISLII